MDAVEDQLIEFTTNPKRARLHRKEKPKVSTFIPVDLIENGEIQFINLISALISPRYIRMMNLLAEYNLLGADPMRFQAFKNPVQVSRIDSTPG